MSIEFVPGTLCVYGDRVVQIDGMDSLAHATVRDTANGNIVLAPISKLRALPAKAKNSEIVYVPEAEWNRCAALAKDLLPKISHTQVPRSELEPIAARHGLSLRQLQRLRKKLRADPRASTLARSPGGRPEGLNRLSDRVHEITIHVVRKHFYRRERPCKMDIVERVRSMCRRLGMEPPSKNAIIRRINRQLGYDADAARLGRKAALQIWEPRPGRLNALQPLELVQIDHTRVDVIVLSDDRQTQIGRPWITLAIDVCTRVVLGFYLSMDAPSSVSVSLCIEHAVLPKPEDAEQPGLWPIFGKPKCIHADNGKDLRAEALKRGCQQHGIDLQWRPVRTPHFGAHIERLNGTLMRLCHLLPGTTFSNPRERGDYDSAKRATLTFGELKAWMVEKICRYYHVRRHRALQLPPIVAWRDAHTDEAGQVRQPPLVADPQSFRTDFLPYEFRRINRTGIELHGSRYWHNDLRDLLRSPESAMVRYDPRRRQSVWVRLADETLVEAPAVAGPAAGDRAARTALDAATIAELNRAIDKHFENCDAIEERAAKATRQARRKRPTARVAAPPPPAATTDAKPEEATPAAPAAEVENASDGGAPSVTQPVGQQPPTVPAGPRIKPSRARRGGRAGQTRGDGEATAPTGRESDARPAPTSHARRSPATPLTVEDWI